MNAPAEAVGTPNTIDPAGAPPLLALAESAGFQAASRFVLDFLNQNMQMGFWSVTRVENDRQTYLYLDENGFGLSRGGSTPWEDTFCRQMVAGNAPRIAPDAQAFPAYASARANPTPPVGAYAGAPI